MIMNSPFHDARYIQDRLESAEGMVLDLKDSMEIVACSIERFGRQVTWKQIVSIVNELEADGIIIVI